MRLTEANMAIRSQNVSASEVGALLGPHPYMTPERIWDRLVSPFPMERPQSQAMAAGTFLELPILRLAEVRLAIRVRANSKTYQHKKSHLCATPDGLLYAPFSGVLETKLMRDGWRSLPPYAEWQVRAQLACTDRYTGIVFVLAGGGSHSFIVEREQDKEDLLLRTVDRFWNDNVIGLQRPLAAPVDEELVMRIP